MSGDVQPIAGPVLETCLYAADLDETARFYEAVLGLRVIARLEGRHVFFRAGAGVFLLFDPAATGAGGDVPGHGAIGPGHVAFAVPAHSLVAWRTRLAVHEIEVERVVDWPRGGSSLYLRDPAGNSVELATPEIWSIPEHEVFAKGSAEQI